MVLVPLVVRPIAGRSGSTLLMRLLATSPLIAFDRVPPFERRYLRYLVARSLAMHPKRAPSDSPPSRGSPEAQAADTRENSTSPPDVSTFQAQDPLPADPQIFDLDEFIRISHTRLWEAFSEAVIQKAPEPTPVYYAEKFVDVDLSTVDVPIKFLYLARDPRDVWASINAFDEKRGYYGFGRHEGESRQDYMDRFMGWIERISRVVRERSKDDLLIRYEDLIQNPTGEVERLQDWLGVELDAEAIGQDEPRLRKHMTSGSADSSIGRWRQDLPPSEQQTMTARLTGPLEQYGYSTT